MQPVRDRLQIAPDLDGESRRFLDVVAGFIRQVAPRGQAFKLGQEVIGERLSRVRSPSFSLRCSAVPSDGRSTSG